ncbi:MAG: tyrosine-protein phosphatase [Acidobacteria bacterium]|nr:tyrosine-protein phosphatase [Acidobacteriota bacterium]
MKNEIKPDTPRPAQFRITPSGLVLCLVTVLLAAAAAQAHACLALRGVDLSDLLAAVHHPDAAVRDARWARPMPPTPGVGNFHQVSPDLYRGAQPTAEGFARLRALGIRTVVNLRWAHSDRDLLGSTGLGYIHIPTETLLLGDREVVAFLRAVADPSKRPLFVHCAHGADRTGTLCAVYRVVVQGWSREDAIREMTAGGYGFHRGYGNLVHYLQTLEIGKIRAEAGF